MKIPPEYLPIMPYLLIEDAKGFKEFMMSVFGATEQFIQLNEDAKLIRHGELRIGDAVIMYADAIEKYPPRPSGMFIYVENADKIYSAALEKGAKSLTKPDRVEYGYSGGFEDKWGNQWWITEP